jgi:hypothetical protein
MGVSIYTSTTGAVSSTSVWCGCGWRSQLYTCNPQAATHGHGAGAFALSVFAVVPCGYVVSMMWQVLRDLVCTLQVPHFTGLLAPPWCRFPEFIIIPLSTLRAGACSSGAGVGIVVGQLGMLFRVIVLLLV